MRLNVRVVGLANSRQMIFDEEGIDLTNWQEKLNGADQSPSAKAQISDFTDLIIEKNLRNSIFVDVTASAEVVLMYPKLLRKSVSIVACNKIACSSEFVIYQSFKGFDARIQHGFFV